jgi:hypothetical protein
MILKNHICSKCGEKGHTPKFCEVPSQVLTVNMKNVPKFGVGIELELIDTCIMISRVDHDCIFIFVGDILKTINGQPVVDLTVATNALKGDLATEVKVTVMRDTYMAEIILYRGCATDVKRISDMQQQEERALKQLPYYCFKCLRVSSTTEPECLCKSHGHTIHKCSSTNPPPPNPFVKTYADIGIKLNTDLHITDVVPYSTGDIYGLMRGDKIIHVMHNRRSGSACIYKCEDGDDFTWGEIGSRCVICLHRDGRDITVSLWRGCAADFRKMGEDKKLDKASRDAYRLQVEEVYITNKLDSLIENKKDLVEQMTFLNHCVDYPKEAVSTERRRLSRIKQTTTRDIERLSESLIAAKVFATAADEKERRLMEEIAKSRYIATHQSPLDLSNFNLNGKYYDAKLLADELGAKAYCLMTNSHAVDVMPAKNQDNFLKLVNWNNVEQKFQVVGYDLWFPDYYNMALHSLFAAKVRTVADASAAAEAQAAEAKAAVEAKAEAKAAVEAKATAEAKAAV